MSIWGYLVAVLDDIAVVVDEMAFVVVFNDGSADRLSVR